MNSAICSKKGYLHSVVLELNPDWVRCYFCGENIIPLTLPSSANPQIDMVDLTEDSPIPPTHARSRRLQHAPAPAMTIPSYNPAQLESAVNQGNQSRSLHAQATRTKSIPNTPIELAITLYTAAYKCISSGQLDIRKWQSGSPTIAGRVGNCFVTNATHNYPSHADLVRSVAARATTDATYRAVDWEFISGCTSNSSQSIVFFSQEVLETTSLAAFLNAINPQSPHPTRVNLSLLYAYEAKEEEDNMITPVPVRKKKVKGEKDLSLPIQNKPPTQSPINRKRKASTQSAPATDKKVKVDKKKEEILVLLEKSNEEDDLAAFFDTDVDGSDLNGQDNMVIEVAGQGSEDLEALISDDGSREVIEEDVISTGRKTGSKQPLPPLSMVTRQRK